MSLHLLVTREGQFQEDVSELEKTALREVLDVLQADDGGEMISPDALKHVSALALKRAGEKIPSEVQVVNVAATGRLIMTHGILPSPFEQPEERFKAQ